MKRTQKTNRPSHAIYIVEGDGENAFWTKVGSMWPHEDGEGFSIQLSALPLDGRLTVRKPRPKAEQEAGR